VCPDRRRRQTTVFAPGEKPVAGSGIGAARVRVADVGGKEFDVAPGGFIAEISDQRRHDIRCTLVGGDLGLLYRCRKLVLDVCQSAPPIMGEIGEQ
jgi:hypothetical protein